ncbi:hypothetical protein MNBD_GAMMA05-923 [hydrothermal vent metagenome]|uniref:Uncharacterized protein n=1 Tax=hydrothermal vent metagenome TaxID=652676 RepID=A0A3B0WGV7_9ZZZZ
MSSLAPFGSLNCQIKSNMLLLYQTVNTCQSCISAYLRYQYGGKHSKYKSVMFFSNYLTIVAEKHDTVSITCQYQCK